MYITVEKKDDNYILAEIVGELKCLNIYGHINQTISCNPQDNYAIFSELLGNAKKYIFTLKNPGKSN